MKIISKNKDYYDGVAFSKGIDPNLVWVRKENSVKLDSKILDHIYQLNWFNYNDEKCTLKIVIIGFCGQLYLCFEIYKYMSNQLIKRFYDIEYAETLLEKYNRSWYSNEKPIATIKNYLKNQNILNLFHQLKEPIFIIKNIDNYGQDLRLETGQLLKDYDFYSIIDSWTAFGKIEQFIGGVIGQKENQKIEVSDRSKIESKGFDFKWSFRKRSKK